MRELNLKVGYWNIKGLKNVENNLKTDEDDVINTICKHDLFCLSEIQCDNNDIQELKDYGCFKWSREKTRKINRFFGGLAIYYKQSIRSGIKFIDKHEDFVWVKLCKKYVHMFYILAT